MRGSKVGLLLIRKQLLQITILYWKSYLGAKFPQTIGNQKRNNRQESERIQCSASFSLFLQFG